jgi:dTDP-4-amino-4,6-dideoxygalactose transaminase
MIAARRPVESPDLDGPAAPEPAVPPFAVRFSEAVIGEFTAACEQIARSGTLTLGPHTTRFEALVADLAGTADAVAVTSGTTALELAFEGLGLKNDLVLVPTNTSPAIAAAAVRAGHSIRFYDAGAGHAGRPAGSFGDAAAFSFFPTKASSFAACPPWPPGPRSFPWPPPCWPSPRSATG